MAAQVHLLKELRPEALAAMEVSSVDGFQGREKEAVIISMVRARWCPPRAARSPLENPPCGVRLRCSSILEPDRSSGMHAHQQ